MDNEMCVGLVGYSERGMVNALCYDLYRSADVQQVETFLKWFDFSHLDKQERPCFSDIKNAQLIVEQSFSDFGDLDLLVLLEQRSPLRSGRAPAKQAVLIEAKVSTDTNSWQTLGDRFDEFLRMVDGGEGSTSNLFVQLHRKVRLVEFLTNKDVAFAPDIFTPRGSLGTNKVVVGAKQALEGFIKAGGPAWYGAIVPDDPAAVSAFARDTLPMGNIKERLPQWDERHWGFLSWHTIKARVEAQAGQWPLTRETFKWNRGQIFRDDPPIAHDVQPGQICCHNGQHYFVVPGRKGKEIRVAKLHDHNPVYFWTTVTLTSSTLLPCPDPVLAVEVPFLPTAGLKYPWVDRKDGLRPTKEPHPAGLLDGTCVQILGTSWSTTRVRLITDELEPQDFLVYTHYLQRDPIP